MKYRKKPVMIEALQFNGSLDDVDQMNKAWGAKFWNAHTVGDGFFTLKIKTLEGTHTANVGDWIIKGIKGEFYPCKPDIFELTYEEVL